MSVMPYSTEKSPFLQVAESYLEDPFNRPRALKLLWNLLDGERISNRDPIRSRSLNHRPYQTPQRREDHLEEHWFGKTWNRGQNQWDEQQPFDVLNGPWYTGHWNFWYGECEKITRETLIRALSISLGLPREPQAITNQYHGQDRPQQYHEGVNRGPQHWPITFLQNCPSPWWEGWIEFKEWGQGVHEGHVTVVLSTPAHGVPLFNTPVRPASQVGNDPFNAYEKNPPDRRGPHGLWVVSQVLNRKYSRPRYPSAPTPPRRWGKPVLGAPVESVGDVVCVSPAVGHGGVAPGGIPYQP